jgi:hypothetical protein
VTENATLNAAMAALDDCGAALEKLDALCCEPGRSPRIAALAATVAQVRSQLRSIDGSIAVADQLLRHLEDAGGQTGVLQVGCCAPNRLPLYTRVLENLTTAQRSINASVGRGH